MEENKKLTYEQLEKIALEMQQRCLMAENRLKAINFTATRLDYLFKVIQYEDTFNVDFVEKCVREIEELLTLEENTKETEETK